LQNYFTKILEDDLKAKIKPQYVDELPRAVKGVVGEILQARDETGRREQLIEDLDLTNVLDRQVHQLSGGELQRLAICLALGTPADVYLIDEPSAYLDSEQRINCAKVIKRFIMHSKKTAFVVEHDFIMATYLGDRVVVYTGNPGIEAKATSPQSLLSGMNQFLKSLEVTFRRDPINFRPR
jgi:ATP-binding cassette subfamily E protein 1